MPDLVINFFLTYTEITVNCMPWPCCSKLMTLLVNISLEFQMLISEECQIFLLKKCEKLCSDCKSFSHFFKKQKNSVFGYKVVKDVTSRSLHELVKLTMPLTTGPSSLGQHCLPSSFHRILDIPPFLSQWTCPALSCG